MDKFTLVHPIIAFFLNPLPLHTKSSDRVKEKGGEINFPHS